MGLRPWSPGLGIWVLDLEYQVLGSGSQVPGPGLKISIFYSRVHSVIITKCDKKLLENVTVIVKCDRKVLQSVTCITKYDKNLLQSVTRSYCKL